MIGKVEEKPDVEVPKENEKVKIYTPEECLPSMLHSLKHGKVKGSTTHNSLIDQCWTWRPEEFNIWTGYANEGKSLFIKQLAMAKALKSDWKFAFCSPEDYPPEEFFDDMVHTLSGLSTDKDNPAQIKESLYRDIISLMHNHFYFVYIEPPNNTIKGVLEQFRILHESVGLNACIIDPLLKFARPKGFSERDDIYASYIGSIAVDFARQTKTSLHLVMHQLTPKIGDDKKYPQPSMYAMKGGGSWADGADNVLSVWRPEYATDKTKPDVEFASQKIKKQKLVGLPQKLKIKFDRRSNRYTDFTTNKPLFDFDKWIYEK